MTSDLDGRFVLRDGTLTLSSVRFEVPGASVNLQGRYGLVSGALDFTGTLQMNARVSETQTGWKALLLRAVDPIFAKKGAGAVIPIRITGTREKPEFGMDTNGVEDRERWRGKLGWMTGIEPATTGATVRCSTIELHSPHEPDAQACGRPRNPQV